MCSVSMNCYIATNNCFMSRAKRWSVICLYGQTGWLSKFRRSTIHCIYLSSVVKQSKTLLSDTFATIEDNVWLEIFPRTAFKSVKTSTLSSLIGRESISAAMGAAIFVVFVVTVKICTPPYKTSRLISRYKVNVSYQSLFLFVLK